MRTLVSKAAIGRALLLSGLLICEQLICVLTTRAEESCGYRGFACPDQSDPPPCTDPFACCRPGGGPGGPRGPGPGGPFGPPGGPPGPVIMPGIGCGSCTGGSVPQTPYGSSIFWISDPACNLRIEDLPLWYNPARGPQVAFRLSYRQRGSAVEDPAVFGVGTTNWSCSFRAYLMDLSSSSGAIPLHRGGAGYIIYTNNVTQYLDGSVLTSVAGGYQITVVQN